MTAFNRKGLHPECDSAEPHFPYSAMMLPQEALHVSVSLVEQNLQEYLADVTHEGKLPMPEMQQDSNQVRV